MNLFNLWVSHAIKIDFDEEITYSHDQAYINYPTVFPTVSFTLLATGFLCEAGKAKLNNSDAADEDFSFYICKGVTQNRIVVSDKIECLHLDRTCACVTKYTACAASTHYQF